MTVAQNIACLRPAAMQSRPVRLEQIFDDPGAIMDLIAQRAPYLSLAEFHGMHDTLGGARARPVFRAQFDDEIFLQNPRWMTAAREAFSAKIVRPFKCIHNLNGPMGMGGVHVDLPVYRGFAAPAVPVWLLMNMTYSGLFHSWMIPVASGLAWFWRGVGGAFEYWADGPDAPPQVESPPMWNCGVMSDNEFMWHGVGPTGTPEDQADLKGKLNGREKLHHAGDGNWEIREGTRAAARFSGPQLRISLLWKAYVFLDEDHLSSFEQRDMDLSLEQVVHLYREDLADKGICVAEPSDPFRDDSWRKTLEKTYLSPFSSAAGNYQ